MQSPDSLGSSHMRAFYSTGTHDRSFTLFSAVLLVFMYPAFLTVFMLRMAATMLSEIHL